MTGPLLNRNCRCVWIWQPRPWWDLALDFLRETWATAGKNIYPDEPSAWEGLEDD